MVHYLKNGLAMAFSLIMLYPDYAHAQLDLLPCTCMTSSLELVPEASYEIIIVKEDESEGFSWRYEDPSKDTALKEVVQEETIPYKSELKAPFYDIFQGRDRYVHTNLESLRSSTDRRVTSKGKIRVRNKKTKKYKGRCPSFN